LVNTYLNSKGISIAQKMVKGNISEQIQPVEITGLNGVITFRSIRTNNKKCLSCHQDASLFKPIGVLALMRLKRN
jgi:hypothetical protein